MEPKKPKKKIRYTLMIISDSAEGGIRQFLLHKGMLWTAAGLAAACILLCIGYCVHTSVILDKAEEANQALSTKVEELSQENESLSVQNTELSENVTLLSDTINQKVQKEEEELQKSIPTGFPLAGAATVLKSSDIVAGGQQAEDGAEAGGGQQAEDGAEAGRQEQDEAMDTAGETAEEEPQEPIVVFSASTGTSVIVTGNGVVESIETDEEYGTIIRVDHGNGYQSIYRNPSPAKVKAGDEITKGTMLIEMTTEDELLGYQIMKDGEYIDPLTLMEIYG